MVESNLDRDQYWPVCGRRAPTQWRNEGREDDAMPPFARCGGFVGGRNQSGSTNDGARCFGLWRRPWVEGPEALKTLLLVILAPVWLIQTKMEAGANRRATTPPRRRVRGWGDTKDFRTKASRTRSQRTMCVCWKPDGPSKQAKQTRLSTSTIGTMLGITRSRSPLFP